MIEKTDGKTDGRKAYVLRTRILRVTAVHIHSNLFSSLTIIGRDFKRNAAGVGQSPDSLIGPASSAKPDPGKMPPW